MLNDERIRFYFRHQEQLEEWFALRLDAAAAVDQWLTDLGGDVASLAADLGTDVEYFEAIEGSAWPSICLKRASWPGNKDLTAPVLIGMQWVRGKTLLGESTSPYVGVHSDKKLPLGARLGANQAFQEQRKLRKEKASQWWPAYKYVSPKDPFPEGAANYRVELINALRETWMAYAAIVDTVVKDMPGS